MFYIIGKGVNSDHPVEKGRVRGVVTIGSWIIEPISDKRCRVTRLVHADPKGSVPSFIINFAVTKTAEQVVNMRASALEWAKEKK